MSRQDGVLDRGFISDKGGPGFRVARACVRETLERPEQRRRCCVERATTRYGTL